MEAHETLASSYCRQGDLDREEYHLREALKLSPQSVELLMRLGFALNAKGDDCSARDCFASALGVRLDGNSPHLVSLLESKEFDELISILGEKATSTKTPEDYKNLGLAFMAAGIPGGAARAWVDAQKAEESA